MDERPAHDGRPREEHEKDDTSRGTKTPPRDQPECLLKVIGWSAVHQRKAHVMVVRGGPRFCHGFPSGPCSLARVRHAGVPTVTRPTLLVHTRRSISHAIGVRCSRGQYMVSPT